MNCFTVALLVAASIAVSYAAPSPPEGYATSPPENVIGPLIDAWCSAYAEHHSSQKQKMKKTYASFEAYCTAQGVKVTYKQYYKAWIKYDVESEEYRISCGKSLRQPGIGNYGCLLVADPKLQSRDHGADH